MPIKILFSNIGYAKGIGGSLMEHAAGIFRHFYIKPSAQEEILGQLKEIIVTEKPEVCCFVEIDAGSFHTAYFNQIQALLDEEYTFHDITGKYGPDHWLRRMPLHVGKSNGFIAKHVFPFERLYFSSGSKRLIYHITLPDNINLFFAHFSLNRKTRQMQFQELRVWIDKIPGQKIIVGDFNIMQGFAELKPLLDGTDLVILNNEEDHTFAFHRYTLALDLCICSESLAGKAHLRLIDQPFSDHDALVVEIT
jgi:hypothetical protein